MQGQIPLSDSASPENVPKTRNHLYCKTLAKEHETQEGENNKTHKTPLI